MIPFGTISRWGDVRGKGAGMDFVNNLGDTGNLPEFSVGGVARVEIIDNAIVRVTLFKSCCKDPMAPKVPVCELVMTLAAWCATRAVGAMVTAEIARIVHGVEQTAVGEVSSRHH